MVSDDVVYGCVLIFSLPTGLLIRGMNSSAKKFVSAGLGFLTLTLACRWDVFHGLLTGAVNCLIIFQTPQRWCHALSFGWCFAYLAVFRTAPRLGLPPPSAIANAAQLLLTLRLVGLAFEVHDSAQTVQDLELAARQEGEEKSALSAQKVPKDGKTLDLEADSEASLFKRFRYVSPTVLDILCYSYSYMGLLTGPYFSFRTYQDFLHNDHVPWAPTRVAMLDRLKVVPICALVFLLLAPNFKVTYAETEEFLGRSLWYRLFYMVPVFGACRARLYAAWLLAEAGCIAVGLGAYPAEATPRPGLGPAHLHALARKRAQSGETQWNFETVRNLQLGECELAPTLRQLIRSWNMTVQYWMVANVYRRIPHKTLRQVVTLTVSAYWHGVHPGYYLSALTIPPVLLAESAMIAVYRKHLSAQAQRIFDFGCLFFRSRAIDYMCMSFLLLRLDAAWRYWSSVYFVIHVTSLLLLLVAGFGHVVLPSGGKTTNNNDVTSVPGPDISKHSDKKKH